MEGRTNASVSQVLVQLAQRTQQDWRAASYERELVDGHNMYSKRMDGLTHVRCGCSCVEVEFEVEVEVEAKGTMV